MSVIKTGVLEGSSDSEEEVHVYKLKIHDTEVKDAGEWRVEVADKYGSTSTSCNLAILDETKPKPAVSYQLKGVDSDEEDKFVSAASARDLYLDPYSRPCRPRFVTFLKDQKAEEGFCVKFQCVVSGNPTPRVEWYKDMEPVSRSSFMHTSYRGDGTACLQLFSPVADRDSGTYRCVARNSEGSCHSEAILSIQKQVTNADLRDQFSISRARTRNEDLANFTGHHTSKFQAAERMLLKSDKYSFETSPRLKKSELYHLEPQFRGHRKSDLYTFADSRRGKKYETSEFDEDIFEKKSTYNIENDYKPRKRYEDDYKTDFKGKSSSNEFENDYKINKSAEIYNASYKYGSGKKSILEELDSQRKLESKKIYDSILSNRSDDFGGYGSSYATKRTGLSKEINPGLSTKAKELSRGRSLATDVNLGRSKSMPLGRENSSRLFLDPKKGYYTLRPRPKSVALTKDYSSYDSRPQSSSVSRDYPSFESRAKSVSVTRDVSSYDRRPKSMSVARDFDARTGYESDREEYISATHYRPRSASFSRDLTSSRNTRSASLARDYPVKPKRELDDDEERTREREDRSRAASLTRDTEELIRSLRESSVGRSDFADIEAYRAELHGKQKKDKGTRSQTCKKKQKGKEVKYQMFVKHFADENKPIKEINPGLSMKAREIVNRQGYRYKVDRDLLNLSMSRNKSKSYPTDESDEDEPKVKRYTKLTSSREPESDEEEVSNEAFKRKMYLQNLDRFINRANQSFDYMEDTEVPSWRKERLEDTGYDYTRHMARKNKIDLFDFDDIRTAKLTATVNRQQQTRRAQSVGPEMGAKSSKPLNTKYDKERMALLNLGTNWVRDKPISFTERLKSKSVIEGNSVLLSCFVTGKEPFVVLWYRRGIPLPRDEEENFHIRSNGGFLSLEIPVASTYDTGEYMVEVRNEEGKIKSTCYIQVEPTFDPRVDYKHPEFIEPMHHVHVKAGQAATFSCRVKGHPIPFVRWFKDGIELQPTDRINIHQGEKGQAFLLIHDTEEQDTGLYKCEAQSMAGRCRSSATLQVLETLADAFDDVSCNLEVERIISRTKSEKGEVKEAPMLKPRAWRKGLETTQTQATESQAKQDETVVSETDTAKETPLKTSEILTVLDETLKAAPIEMSSEASRSSALLTDSDKDQFALPSTSTDIPAQAPDSSSVDISADSSNTVVNQTANTDRVLTEQTELDKTESLKPNNAENLINQTGTQKTELSAYSRSDVLMNQNQNESPKQKFGEDSNKQTEHQKITAEMMNQTCLQQIESQKQSTPEKLASQDETPETTNVENQKNLVESFEETDAENMKNQLEPSLIKANGENLINQFESSLETNTENLINEVETPLKTNSDNLINQVESLLHANDEKLINQTDSQESEFQNQKTTENQMNKILSLSQISAEGPTESQNYNVGCKETQPLGSTHEKKNILTPFDSIALKEHNAEPKQILSSTEEESKQQSGKSKHISGDEELSKISTLEMNDETTLDSTPNFPKSAESSSCDIEKNLLISNGEVIPNSSKNLSKLGSKMNEETEPASAEGESASTQQLNGKYKTNAMSVASKEMVDKVDTKAQSLESGGSDSTTSVEEKMIETVQSSGAHTDEKSVMDNIREKVIADKNDNALKLASDSNKNIPDTCVQLSEAELSSSKFSNGEFQDSLSTAHSSSVATPANMPPSETSEISTLTDLTPKSNETQEKSTVNQSEVDISNFEVLSASAQRVSSPIEKKTKPTDQGVADKPMSAESPKPKAEVQASDIIDGSVPMDEKAPVVEVKESSEKPESPKTEKTDVPDGELMKEEVATKDTRASVEEAPEQREKPGTGVAESGEKIASELKLEKEEEVPKEEEREPQPPTFVKKLPAKMDLKDGEDLLLQCITEGVPKPDVIWLHGKKVVEATQNTIIKDSHDVHSLEIKKVSHKDHSGSYTAKLVSGSSSSEEEEVVSTCKVFILSTAPAEQKAVVTEENIQDKDMIPLVERQISTEQEELKLEIPTSVDLQEVCEEGQTDADKMHIPVVSPTGVQCHSSPLDEASKEGELPPSQTSPHFSQPLEEELYPLERDENVRIQCVVAGEPCPKIVWFKDGEKLEPSSRIRLEWDPDTRIASVLLKRLHILDTGEYECIVYGENGSYSTKTTLHVKALEMQKVETVDRDDPPENVPPKCFLSLKDKKVYQGKSTTLDCVIKGVPEPEVKWLRHGKEIFSRSGKYILTAINQQYSLTVEDFKKSDEGCYTIEASNDSGSCSSSAYLTMEAVTQEVESVTPETSLPEFTSKMEGLMVPVGGTVTFKCSASGYPVPKFKWQKDMLDLYQSHRITVDNTPGETALTINDVNRRDGGMYVCVAKNSLGRIKQTAKLIVSEDCKETRRLSISGEMDRPDEPGLSQTDSSDKPSDDKGSEAVEEKQEESSQSKDNQDACNESAVNAAEPSNDLQQNENSLMQETPAVKEETSKVEDQTPTEESTEQKEAPKEEEVKETLSKTEEAVASVQPTEEKEKAATVESEDAQKEPILEKAPVESVSTVEKTQIDDTHVEKVARKEEEKKEMEASEKTPVESVSTVEKSQVDDTHVEEVVTKEEEKKGMDDMTVPSQEKSPVQVPEEKIMSALKTVDSVEEVSLIENVDFAAVENVSLIKKEEKTTEQETDLVKKINDKDETDVQNVAKLNENVQEKNETSTEIEKREEEKKVNEIKDTKENVTESKSSASSEISKSEESTVKVSVQAAENSKAQKSTSEDVELDIDQLVQQAETILGETASAKPEVQDLSFEEVLAKSVLEESVAEAASEMEKVNKTKKRRLSKTKRRSQSLESEEAFSEKNEGEETTITKSKESNTEAHKSVTEVTESISQKESAALQKSSKTKSVSFEEVVKTSASSDMVDSSLVSLETSTSKMSVSKSESISTERSFELKENVEKLKISGEEDSEISVAKTEQTTSSATKTETRALDRLMSIEDVKEILDVDSLKMNETREAIVEQKTASGKTQVLEVSARRVSKQLSVEEQAAVATHRHHLHHPPEIIVPPENQLISLHSEIELTVKVRAAHGAKISWYHDGQKVAVTEKALKEIYGEHYELTEEEILENQ
uniref:Muscle M-line assembly protein unc-89-like isoform X1 n=1 Tax=Crassostrea virginica TaxID=6565 RepID=A0A8B8BG23_CRAVI|nr:muscle M-line assembly protein unc-89-like isoform X1 [Crassostrea virginica]